MTRAALVLLSLLALGGCSKEQIDATLEVEADDPFLDRASTVEIGGDVLGWQTVPWATEAECQLEQDGMPVDNNWIVYPAHTEVRIHHALGRTPIGLQVYLAFTSVGCNPGTAAGDLARVAEVTDEVVTVWNDTDADYFIRVVVF